MTRVHCPMCGKLAFWAENGKLEAKCPTCGRFVKAVLMGDKIIETAIVPPRNKIA